ncbi:MAG: aldo/keto reductase [Propionibacteriaceae bacterium]|jgi:2,5-diketo-D-gluconate reductase A|nr:aldo/keto reductase [Propionibacteriaceae bacterium]
MAVPFLTLSDGNTIPQLGFGVFKVEPELTQGVVEEALAAGYRHIDTATGYHNEEAVGKAIRASGIPRESLFVTTKLSNVDHKSGDIRGAYERSLAWLDIDYIDLYLIHWPMPAQEKYLGAWEKLIEFKSEGLTKSIGVSNFQVSQLQHIIEATGVAPVVDQVELHPLFQQKELLTYLDTKDVTVETWGPLGQGRWDLSAYPALTDAAIAHRKTPAQVILRWHIQTGHITIPKTTHRERMDENIDIFDFELNADEMKAIAALDTGKRLGGNPDDVNG